MTPPPEIDEFGIYEPDHGRAIFIVAYVVVASGGGLIGLIAGLLIGGVI